MRLWGVLIVGLWSCVYAQGTEISWVKMFAGTRINAPVGCITTPVSGEFYLSSEWEGASASVFRIQNTIQILPFSNIYKWLDFTASERNALKVYRDKKGNVWMDEFPLSDRLLKWVLYYPTQRESCRLPQPVRVVTSTLPTVKFDLEGIEEGVLTSRAKSVNVKGELVNGQQFDIDIELSQQFQPWGW